MAEGNVYILDNLMEIRNADVGGVFDVTKTSKIQTNQDDEKSK